MPSKPCLRLFEQMGYPQEPCDDEYEAEWAALSWLQRYDMPALLVVVVVGLLVPMRML